MRDVEDTRRRILEAAGRLLAREGPRGVGITAIAGEARLGKPLLYRYFGGLDGILEALGKGASFWPSEVEQGRGVGARLVALARGLRARPRTLEALGWQMAEKSELSRRLDVLLRDEGRALRAERAIEDPDEAAMDAVLLAGVLYLAVRARRGKELAGVPLRTAQDWARIERAVERLAQRDRPVGASPARASPVRASDA